MYNSLDSLTANGITNFDVDAYIRGVPPRYQGNPYPNPHYLPGDEPISPFGSFGAYDNNYIGMVPNYQPVKTPQMYQQPNQDNFVSGAFKDNSKSHSALTFENILTGALLIGAGYIAGKSPAAKEFIANLKNNKSIGKFVEKAETYAQKAKESATETAVSIKSSAQKQVQDVRAKVSENIAKNNIATSTQTQAATVENAEKAAAKPVNQAINDSTKNTANAIKEGENLSETVGKDKKSVLSKIKDQWAQLPKPVRVGAGILAGIAVAYEVIGTIIGVAAASQMQALRAAQMGQTRAVPNQGGRMQHSPAAKTPTTNAPLI